MTDAGSVVAQIEIWTSPPLLLIYCILVLVMMTYYYQWKWAKKCDEEVRLFIVKSDGSTDTQYAPKAGNYVALKAPNNDTVRMWPIVKLSAIETLYPGDGFIPKFLQKRIRTVILDNDDWEPMLNRGSYSQNVASPDVVERLRAVATEHPEVADELSGMLDSISTASTREMIASPALLGNLMHEKITEAVITVNKEMLDSMTKLMSGFKRILSPSTFYIGIGLVVIAVVFVIYQVMPLAEDIAAIAERLDAVAKNLGVP